MISKYHIEYSETLKMWVLESIEDRIRYSVYGDGDLEVFTKNLDTTFIGFHFDGSPCKRESLGIEKFQYDF